MKKLLTIAFVAALLPFIGISFANAASWTDQVQTAIKSGNYDQINVIAAKNPEAQGDIAIYLLQQSQNSALSQDTRIKLFVAAAPFGSQITPENSAQAATLIGSMLTLTADPTFEQNNHQAASSVIAAALGLSDQPNILSSNPTVHQTALAEANEFPAQAGDQGLQDQVDLALQVGLSPPVGPRYIITPNSIPNPSPQ